jgi:hypothetical protein
VQVDTRWAAADPGNYRKYATTTADGILRVRNMQGRLYVERPAPGDDAQHVARKLLREKCGYSPFHAPIWYPRSYH